MEDEDLIKAWVDPEHWTYVIENGDLVNFYLPSIADSLSSVGGPPPPAPVEVAKTDYETRVQYTVNYFQKSENNDSITNFVSRSRYNEPVEFEVTGSADKLPALEETKDVISPHSHIPEFRGFNTSGKKAKLGQLDRIGETTLRIHSPYLLNIIKAVIEYSAEAPGRNWQGPNAGQYFTPYRDLYYHLPDLERYKLEPSKLRQDHSDEFNQKYDEHFDLLKAYLESQPNMPIVEARAQWTSKTPVTTFASYWLLLKPGTDVYVQEPDGSLNAYVVHQVTGGVYMEDGKRKTDPYTVYVWNLVFGGRHIFRRLRPLPVPVFDNEREIIELPVIPVSFIDFNDNGALKQRLIKRGKKYFQYSKGPCFLQYTGQGAKEGNKSVCQVISMRARTEG